MILTQKCEYALRVALELSKSYGGKLLHCDEIASNRGVPRKFLDQIMLVLRKNGLILSKKGPNGGYALAKHPEEIFLGEIIRAVDGPLFQGAQNQGLNKYEDEVVQGVWGQCSDAMSGVLDNVSLRDVQENANKAMSEHAYDYVI